MGSKPEKPWRGEKSSTSSKRSTTRLGKGPRHRSRGGCQTCKQKHLKCDETRPACQQCAKKGLVCEGYSRDFKWSYKHQPLQDTAVDEEAAMLPEPSDEPLRVPNVTESDPEETPRSLQNEPHTPSQSISDFHLNDGGGGLPLDVHLSNEYWEDAFLHDSSQLPSLHQMEDQFLGNNTAITSYPSPGIPDLSLPQTLPSLDEEFLFGMGQTQLSFGVQFDTGPDSTMRLIGKWFDEVCPAFSAYDSSTNMNRKLAGDLWHSSAAVFNSLQAMSLGFLSVRLPGMRRPAFNMLRTATICIQAESTALESRTQLTCMPTGLLFSLLCLGTTMCWFDAGQIGIPFLKQAKRLLQRVSPADQDEVLILDFFKKGVVWWEMLISVVDEADLSSGPGDVIPTTLTGPTNSSTATDVDTLLHPWTGISSSIARSFAQSMRLCRAYRRRMSTTKFPANAASLAAALQQINEAQGLYRKLFGLDLSSVGQLTETGDACTPSLHLAHIAEAYRLASLLQLLITFPDLQELNDQRDGEHAWNKGMMSLTLRLVEILESIPPESGSRVVQPLLCICASTGLRYTLPLSLDFGTNENVTQALEDYPTPVENMLDYIGMIDTIEGYESSPNLFSQTAIDVSNARNSIIRRLDVLENTLQPRPVMVAKELVKSVWAAYDEEPPGSSTVHWLDVMAKKGLRTLFG